MRDKLDYWPDRGRNDQPEALRYEGESHGAVRQFFTDRRAALVCNPSVSAQRARVGVFFIDSRPDSFPFGGRRVAWKRRARTPLAGRFPFLNAVPRDECNYTVGLMAAFIVTCSSCRAANEGTES